MVDEYLKITDCPRMTNATMLVALTGWMDGGHVSTGTVKRLMDQRSAPKVAEIEPDLFYIYNFPGSMEIAALFRPEVKFRHGLIRGTLEMPTNEFFCDAEANLLFFLGKEPNLRWQAFADGIFTVARHAGVKRIVFVGSFGGTVPHTREPRMFASISDKSLTPTVKSQGFRLTPYEGPASFSTLLLSQAGQHNMEMLSLVAEIPGYLEGINPLSIEAVTRRLGRILNQSVDLDALRKASNAWELKVTEAVEKDEDLAKTVRKLEQEYDDDLIERETEQGMAEA